MSGFSSGGRRGPLEWEEGQMGEDVGVASVRDSWWEFCCEGKRIVVHFTREAQSEAGAAYGAEVQGRPLRKGLSLVSAGMGSLRQEPRARPRNVF